MSGWAYIGICPDCKGEMYRSPDGKLWVTGVYAQYCGCLLHNIEHRGKEEVDE